jgi:hypothetical protein
MSQSSLLTRGFAFLATVGGVGFALVAARLAYAESTPVGPLPVGPVTKMTTAPGLLVAVALPHARRSSGLVWRIARNYDPRVIQEASEADVDENVVVVYRVVGRGDTSLVFALTRGDASPKAIKVVTAQIHSVPRP